MAHILLLQRLSWVRSLKTLTSHIHWKGYAEEGHKFFNSPVTSHKGSVWARWVRTDNPKQTSKIIDTHTWHSPNSCMRFKVWLNRRTTWTKVSLLEPLTFHHLLLIKPNMLPSKRTRMLGHDGNKCNSLQIFSGPDALVNTCLSFGGGKNDQKEKKKVWNQVRRWGASHRQLMKNSPKHSRLSKGMV